MIRVTRFNAAGEVHHSVLTDAVEVVTTENGTMCIAMPYRWWCMCEGGRIEIAYAEPGQ